MTCFFYATISFICKSFFLFFLFLPLFLKYLIYITKDNRTTIEMIAKKDTTK